MLLARLSASMNALTRFKICEAHSSTYATHPSDENYKAPYEGGRSDGS